MSNGGQPLFVARNQSNQVQPILVKPVVSVGNGGASGGLMVLFGTGRYLAGTDPANTDVQTFYGIWDNGQSGTVGRSGLRAQSIVAETNQFGQRLRETTNHAVDWTTQRGWYIDLIPPGTAPTGPGGERVISQALVRYDRVIFVTMTPDDDPCTPGGRSWLMEVDFSTGSRTAVSVFAYVPAGVYSKLPALTDSAYPHTFYVDGSPAVGDAYWSGAWRTVLVSGLGAGGRSVFALDVTSPTAFDASHVLWEYTDA